MKIVSIDLEYNNKKEVLSAGLIESEDFNIVNIEEIFFKNKTDNKTYKIHGLNNKFLFENGKGKNDELSLKIRLIESNYLIGFDLQHDFKVLGINSNKVYAQNKVIDIKLILEIFNISISLSNFIKKVGIMKDYKNLFPIHTAIMDSFLTNIIFEYLVSYIQQETNFSKKEILHDLAEISNYRFYRNDWLYDIFLNKYYFLNKLFKEINSVKLVKETSIERNVYTLNDNVEIYDENFYIIGKYKKKDFDLSKIKSEKLLNKKEFNIGYRDIL